MQPLANSYSRRDAAVLVHPYTNLQHHQKDGALVMTRGQGVYVYDETGKEYIEGLAGLWCTSLGFNEPRLIEAAMRQFQKLPTYHIFAQKSHDPVVELAERVLAIAPVPMSKVFFANSGSEATDTAIKLAWYYNNALGRPKKKKIISRQRAYHGVTIASASLTGLPNNHRDFDLPIAGILHADCPHYYGYAKPGENEEAFATRMAESLGALILREGPDTIAAFIAEPIMGAGGVLPPVAGYFDKIQPILRKYDILFIADEVITGFARTGNMFGCQTYNLKPDMITVAKALSSAYLPISAVMISEAVSQALIKQSEKIGTFAHGFTYSGHPVAAAVAIETLKIYAERDIVAQVRAIVPAFRAGLDRLAAHPLVGEAPSVGLLGALQLIKDKAAKTVFEASAGVGAFFAGRAQEHGVVIRPMIMDRIGICPPLIITAAQIDEMFRRLALALDDTLAMVRQKGLA